MFPIYTEAGENCHMDLPPPHFPRLFHLTSPAYFPQSYSRYVSTNICIDNHIIVLTNKWFRPVDIGYKGLKASRTVQEWEPPSTFNSTVHEIFL